MFSSFKNHLESQLAEIRAAGTYKRERIITSPQDAHIRVGEGKPVLNMCANNYLGLAEHPAVIQAAREALERWGYGLSSVRFICGTQNHPQGPRGAPKRISGHGGHHSLQLLFRREWRSF